MEIARPHPGRSLQGLDDSGLSAPEVQIGVDPETDDLEAFAQIAFLHEEPHFHSAERNIRAVCESPHNAEYLQSLANHLYAKCKAYRYAAMGQPAGSAMIASHDLLQKISLEREGYDKALRDLRAKVEAAPDYCEMCQVLLIKYENLASRTKEVTAVALSLEERLKACTDAPSIDHIRAKADIQKIMKGVTPTAASRTHDLDVGRLLTDLERTLRGEGVMNPGSEGYYTLPKLNLHGTGEIPVSDGQPREDERTFLKQLADFTVLCNLFLPPDADPQTLEQIASNQLMNIVGTDSIATGLVKLKAAIDSVIARSRGALATKDAELHALEARLAAVEAENRDLATLAHKLKDVDVAFQSYQQDMAQAMHEHQAALDKTLADVVGSFRQEVFSVRAPAAGTGRKWIADNVLTTNVRTVCVSELLQEVMAIIQQALGADALGIDIQMPAPPQLPVDVASNPLISDTAKETLSECQKVGALALAVRYGIESCIEALRGKAAASSQASPLSEAGFVQQIAINAASIVKSLLSMCLWEEKATIRKNLGIQSAEDIYNRTVLPTEGLPEGFVDELLSGNLSVLLQKISPTNMDLVSVLERLAAVLKEAETNDRIVPKMVADLSRITLTIEEQLKQHKELLDLKQRDLDDLAQRYAARNADYDTAQKQILDLEQKVHDKQREFADLKNEIVVLKSEAVRVTTMEGHISEMQGKVERGERVQHEVARERDALREENQKMRQDLQRADKKIMSLVQERDQAILQITTLSEQHNATTSARNEAVDKNKELVQLARAMEAKLKAKTDELNELVRQTSGLREKIPLHEGEVAQLKEYQKKLEAEIHNANQEKRQAHEEMLSAQSEKRIAQRELETLRRESDEAAGTVTELRKEVKRLTAELQERVDLVERQRLDLDTLNRQVSDLSERDLLMEQRMTELVTAREVCQQENEEMHALLAEAQITLQKLERDYDHERQRANAAEGQISNVRSDATGNLVEAAALKREIGRLETMLAEKKEEHAELASRYTREVEELKTRLQQAELGQHLQEQSIRAEYDKAFAARVQEQQMAADSVAAAEAARCQEQLKQAERRYQEVLTEIKNYYTDKVQAEKALKEAQDQLADAGTLRARAEKLAQITKLLRRKVASLAASFEKLALASEGRVRYVALTPDVTLSLGGQRLKKSNLNSTIGDSGLFDDDISVILDDRASPSGTGSYDSAPTQAMAQIALPHDRDVDDLVALIKAGLKYQYDHEELRHLRGELTAARAEVSEERKKVEYVEREKSQLDIELRKAQLENRDLTTNYNVMGRSASASVLAPRIDSVSTLSHAPSSAPLGPSDLTLRRRDLSAYGGSVMTGHPSSMLSGGYQSVLTAANPTTNIPAATGGIAPSTGMPSQLTLNPGTLGSVLGRSSGVSRSGISAPPSVTLPMKIPYTAKMVTTPAAMGSGPMPSYPRSMSTSSLPKPSIGGSLAPSTTLGIGSTLPGTTDLTRPTIPAAYTPAYTPGSLLPYQSTFSM
ncbi:hypothetical protein GMRT_11502 [Giardia muris]|uniref:Uncharacterized protein n=1 Tax=Giardia muris TaxID=5742 RepID=A0A4Z1SYE3_GIAMU|nr:hypothetical protein GMRT_11502 [Giardia muris]|eukprot:TNJ29805.1 hypothetical protein GMRT_11502 [Giardia muris]